MVQSANFKEAKERGGRLSYPTRVKLTKALSVFILIACASCVYPFFASFKSNVATFGGPVLMGDVISETDVPKETLDKIIVAYLPANSSITLTKKYLYNLLKKRVGIIDVEIDLLHNRLRNHQIITICASDAPERWKDCGIRHVAIQCNFVKESGNS